MLAYNVFLGNPPPSPLIAPLSPTTFLPQLRCFIMTYLLIYSSVSTSSMCASCLCFWYAWKPEEGTGSHRNRIIYDFKPPCRY